MADISTITLLKGQTYKTYNIKDAIARSISAGAIRVVGKTTTGLIDNSTTNPIIIDGDSYTAISNDAVFFGTKEFVFDGTRWHEFGDMTGLGALARKDSASGPYIPEGTISHPTFTGAQINSTGKFTPTGSVSAVAKNDGNYQPSGSVSAPTITVQSAGSTTTVNSITDVGTLPSLSLDVDEDLENLTIAFEQGTLPTKGPATLVKTGDPTYTASAPAFTGAKVQLSFTGNESNINVAGMTAGSVSQPTFSGKEATITVS